MKRCVRCNNWVQDYETRCACGYCFDSVGFGGMPDDDKTVAFSGTYNADNGGYPTPEPAVNPNPASGSGMAAAPGAGGSVQTGSGLKNTMGGNSGGGFNPQPAYQNAPQPNPAYQNPSYQNPAQPNPTYQSAPQPNPTYQNPSYYGAPQPNPSYQNPAYSNPAYSNPSYSSPVYTNTMYPDPGASSKKKKIIIFSIVGVVLIGIIIGIILAFSDCGSGSSGGVNSSPEGVVKVMEEAMNGKSDNFMKIIDPKQLNELPSSTRSQMESMMKMGISQEYEAIKAEAGQDYRATCTLISKNSLFKNGGREYYSDIIEDYAAAGYTLEDIIECEVEMKITSSMLGGYGETETQGLTVYKIDGKYYMGSDDMFNF